MYGERLHSFFDLGEILLRGNLILGEVIIYVLIIVINNLKKDCLRKGLFIIRKYVLCLGIVLAICFVIGVIYANLNKVNISEVLSKGNSRLFLWASQRRGDRKGY